jgi:hypothetical protein
MKKFKFFALTLIIPQIFGCAAYMREAGLVASDKELMEYSIPIKYTFNTLPLITLSSSCTSSFPVSVGPFVMIPLPVIPNPIFPFQLYGYNNKDASLTVEIKAPPNFLNWEDVQLLIKVNGMPVNRANIFDNSDVWRQYRRYHFKLDEKCGKFEGKEVLINIQGMPKGIETKPIFLKSRLKIKSS